MPLSLSQQNAVTQLSNIKNLNIMYIPKHLLGRFKSISEAAKAYSEWKTQNKPVGRPKTSDNGVCLGGL